MLFLIQKMDSAANLPGSPSLQNYLIYLILLRHYRLYLANRGIDLHPHAYLVQNIMQLTFNSQDSFNSYEYLVACETILMWIVVSNNVTQI